MKKGMGLKELIAKALASGQQEMMLTLPERLLMAYEGKVHERYLDPQTKEPFASFYRWLWASPPPGCGLCGCAYLDAQDIIRLLERARERRPPGSRGTLNALIEDLVKGHGAAQKPGRKKQGEAKNGGSTPAINGTVRKQASKSPASLAARMAESTDPKVRAAWEDYVEGRHRSVTRAAIVCGLIEDANAPLPRLKQYWRKASAAERRAFRKWQDSPEAE